MQTRSLETLVRIYEVQSFSKAAELRGMTLSALSMQMKALESELDAELFDRTFRPPKLTPLGRKVAERAQSLIREERAIVGLCGTSSPLSGVFQVGFVQSASVRILPNFVKLAKARAPKAQFRFSSGLSEVLEEQVASGQIDCAVITRVGQPEQLLRYDLIATEIMSIAAPADCKGVSDTDLSTRLPFVHFRPSTGIGKLIASFFENSAPSSFSPLVLDGIEACMECVKAGLGYTILPRPDIDRYADNRIAIIELDTRPVARDLVLVSRRSEPNPQWVTALSSLLVEAS